jgi:hypothetical protein
VSRAFKDRKQYLYLGVTIRFSSRVDFLLREFGGVS